MWRFLILLPLILQAEVTALYLSWYGDPTTTMTIQWHTPLDETGDTLFLHIVGDDWEALEGAHTTLEQTLVHKINLVGLKPDTEYKFTVGSDTTPYRFRTAPATLANPLRFVIGGDIYGSTKLFRRMSQTVLENNPDFVVLGGDLAYAITFHPFRASGLRRWLAFLRDWKDYMIHEDGRVIPFLIVPGNHDIAPDNYELFFSLFAFPEKQLYRSIDFGSYLSLLLLDTGHFQPIEGRQTLWLDKALSNRTHISYRFAVYHEAAYPSYYPYYGTTPKKIRTHWTPLFEKYNLHAAFENHNHAYKRTHPIKANKLDETGVIYIGDGSWGVTPRKTNDVWYLAERARKNSVLLVELTEAQASIKALDLLNQPLDSITLSHN